MLLLQPICWITVQQHLRVSASQFELALSTLPYVPPRPTEPLPSLEVYHISHLTVQTILVYPDKQLL